MEQNNTQQDGLISFGDLLKEIKSTVLLLIKKWFFLLVFGVIGVTLGIIISYYSKPEYTATITFALEDDKGGGSVLGGALGLASTLGVDLGTNAGGAFSGVNLLELLKSRKMIERALLKPYNNNLSILDYFLSTKDIGKNLKQSGDTSLHSFKSSLSHLPHTVSQDSVIGIIYNTLSKKALSVYQKDKKVSIITVDVIDEDEKFAKTFCETLVNEVAEFYIETKSKKAKMNVEILERQADSVRAELNGAISGVAVATDEVYNLNSALNKYRSATTRRQVDVQANTAILTQLVTNLELARVSLRKETPLIQLIDTPILPLPQKKLGKFKTGLTGGFLFGIIGVVVVLINNRKKKA